MNLFEYANPVLTPANLFTSPADMIAILVVALIVFGPKKLPEIGRQVGSALREMNKMRGDLQRALDLDEYTRYDSTPQYHSQPYGATYPAHDTTPVVEAYTPPAAAAIDSYSPHDGDVSVMAAETDAAQPKIAPPPGPRAARLAREAAMHPVAHVEAEVTSGDAL